MHRSLAVDTRHLLCYYVLSGRYSHRDEATYANCAPNSGTEEWLKNVPEQQVNTITAPRGARPSSPGCRSKVSRRCLAVFMLFFSKFSQFPALDCSWQTCSRDSNSFIQIKVASSQALTQLFVTGNHVCEKLASPVHWVKSVRGNAAHQAPSQRQWLDDLPGK